MFIHGYLLMEGQKMSKSLGNVLDPFEVIDRFGADALRLLLLPRGVLRPGRLGLGGGLRVPLRERAGQRVREPRQPHAGDDRPLPRRRRAATPSPTRTLAGGEDGLDGLEARVSRAARRAELTQALEEIWARVRRLNRYVEETRPWDLAKDEAQAGRLDQVLYNLAEGIRVLALLLYPYMPETSERLRDALGEPGSGAGGLRLPRRRAAGREAAAALPQDRSAAAA